MKLWINLKFSSLDLAHGTETAQGGAFKNDTKLHVRSYFYGGDIMTLKDRTCS